MDIIDGALYVAGGIVLAVLVMWAVIIGIYGPIALVVWLVGRWRKWWN